MEIFHKLLKSSRGPPKHNAFMATKGTYYFACLLSETQKSQASYTPRCVSLGALIMARGHQAGSPWALWLVRDCLAAFVGEIWVLFSWLRRRHSRSRTSGLESWPVLLSVSLGFSFLLRKMGSWYQRPERAWRALNESIS